jgi:hypothetical protein
VRARLVPEARGETVAVMLIDDDEEDSPALRLSLMEAHRGPARVPGLVIERDREGLRIAPPARQVAVLDGRAVMARNDLLC